MKPEELNGKSLLFVENHGIVDSYSLYMQQKVGLRVLGRTTVPENLHDYLQEQDIEYAVIHPESDKEVDFVVRAIQSGDNILVIRSIEGSRARREKFAIFDRLGTPTFEKRWPGYTPQAIIAALAAQF